MAEIWPHSCSWPNLEVIIFISSNKNSLKGKKNSADGNKNSMEGKKNYVDGNQNSIEGMRIMWIETRIPWRVRSIPGQ